MSGDLKAVFGSTKDDITEVEEEEGEEGEEEEKTTWDQDEVEEKTGKEEEPTPETSLVSADADKEETGFKFSFFGDDAETETKETGKLNLKYLPQTVLEQIFVLRKLCNLSL